MSKGKANLVKKITNPNTWQDPKYTLLRDDPSKVGRPYLDTANVIHTAGQGMTPWTLNHEIGHIYDNQNLTPYERGQIGKLLKSNQPWDWGSSNEVAGGEESTKIPAKETFAQAYAYLKLHKEHAVNPLNKGESVDLSYGHKEQHPRITQGQMELLRSMLINHDRFIRDANGKPIGFKPEFLRK